MIDYDKQTKPLTHLYNNFKNFLHWKWELNYPLSVEAYFLQTFSAFKLDFIAELNKQLKNTFLLLRFNLGKITVFPIIYSGAWEKVHCGEDWEWLFYLFYIGHLHTNES